VQKQEAFFGEQIPPGIGLDPENTPPVLRVGQVFGQQGPDSPVNACLLKPPVYLGRVAQVFDLVQQRVGDGDRGGLKRFGLRHSEEHQSALDDRCGIGDLVQAVGDALFQPVLQDEVLAEVVGQVELRVGGGSSRVDLQACKLGTGRRFTTS
jgi:hypothetical protein